MCRFDRGTRHNSPSEDGDERKDDIAGQVLGAKPTPTGNESTNQGDNRRSSRCHEEKRKFVDGRGFVRVSADYGSHDERASDVDNEVQQQSV
jgi:hypothetical protein